MKKLVALLLALPALCLPVRAASDAEILSRIAAAGSGVTSLRGTFTHVRSMAVSGRTTNMAGDYYYLAPDRLAMHYTTPASDCLIINGDRLHLHLGTPTGTTFDTTHNALMAKLRNLLLDSVCGRVQDIAEANDADIAVKETGDTYLITLSARRRITTGYSRIVLTYRRADCQLIAMQLSEPGGITNLYRISDLQAGPALDAVLFDIPKK